MPELVEVEQYRLLAVGALDRQIGSVSIPDPHAVAAPGPTALRDAVVGRSFVDARRKGKLLLLDTDGGGPTVGLRFGMTGGLVLDGRTAVDRLLYSAGHYDERWVRLRFQFADGGGLALHDPRRFGRVVVQPDESALGPDALTVSAAQLRRALATPTSSAGPPLKSRLMDQARLSGVGNLAADEILWRASLSPLRGSATLSPGELRRLHRHLVATLGDLLARGGSHTGDLMAERRSGGRCRKDGRPLQKTTVGGRTTWWCPGHQR